MSQQQYTTIEMPIWTFIKKGFKYFFIVFCVGVVIGLVEGNYHPLQNYVTNLLFGG